MRSLSDTWHGRFSYDDAPPDNAFVATLLQTGSLLAGAVHEMHNTGAHAGALLHASIAGTRDGAVVRFVKTYAAASPAQFAQVQYDGTLSDDDSEIGGHWRIGTPDAVQASGRFVMVRANRRAFAAARARAESVTAR